MGAQRRARVRSGVEEAMEARGRGESRVTECLWTCPRTLISRFKPSNLLMAACVEVTLLTHEINQPGSLSCIQPKVFPQRLPGHLCPQHSAESSHNLGDTSVSGGKGLSKTQNKGQAKWEETNTRHSCQSRDRRQDAPHPLKGTKHCARDFQGSLTDNSIEKWLLQWLHTRKGKGGCYSGTIRFWIMWG